MTVFHSFKSWRVVSHFSLISSYTSTPSGSRKGISLSFATPSLRTRSSVISTSFAGSPRWAWSSCVKCFKWSCDMLVYSGMVDGVVFTFPLERSFVRNLPGSINRVFIPKCAVSACRPSTSPIYLSAHAISATENINTFESEFRSSVGANRCMPNPPWERSNEYDCSWTLLPEVWQ